MNDPADSQTRSDPVPTNPIFSRRMRRGIGIVLTLSLALNFFAAGWFVSRMVLERGPFDGGPPPPPGPSGPGAPGGGPITERFIVDRLAGALSPDGASRLRQEFQRHEGELRNIVRQLAGLHQELQGIIKAEPIDRDQLRGKMEELGGLMSLRMSIMAEISEQVIPELSPEDRQRMLLMQPPPENFRGGPPPGQM